MDDKTATVHRRDDGTILIRGMGFGRSLSQFLWAALVPEGAVVPPGKLDTAIECLRSMGYRVSEQNGTRAQHSPKRMPLPLPECSHCAAPYRRDYQIQRGDCCVECGQPLTLVQFDPNEDVASLSTTTTPCTHCNRPTRRTQKFCTCGTPTPISGMRHIAPMFPMPEG